MLGDLEERFHELAQAKQRYPIAWYSLEALGLIPFLIRQRFGSLNLPQLTAYTLICAFCFCLALCWEVALVQREAWPLTARLLGVSVIPGRTLFLTIYGSMSLLGASTILIIGSLVARALQRTLNVALENSLVALSSMISVPTLFYLLRPEPLDSALMRLCLLTILWTGTLVIHRRLT